MYQQLNHWTVHRPEPEELKLYDEEVSGFLIEAEEEVKDMTPGVEKAARFMKTLGALWTSSDLKIADKTPQVKIYDLQEDNNVSNAHEVTVPAFPKNELREDMVLCVSMLNLPSTIRSTPYATEYALKYILTTYINEVREAGLLIPRFFFTF